MPPSRLFATSDLHIAYPQNRQLVEDVGTGYADDWLIVAGDVSEQLDDLAWALGRLRDRFAEVVWTPGNHELWTSPRDDPAALRGQAKYDAMVEACRRLGVHTPEDPYPTWAGPGGPLVIVPLFLLYDYSMRRVGGSAAEALEKAYAAGIVCTDEFVLHPDPLPSREAWCDARIEATLPRLAALGGARTVLVSHWPLRREPVLVMRHPEFSIWCGTERTRDWHTRFNAEVAVYGHLHIPRSTVYDGIRFEEVSLGYPREWGARATPPPVLRQILPAPRIGR